MTWIQTNSGVAFDLAAPRVEMVRLDDIAHALSRICRFNGHTRDHYSVAQHSVIVAAAIWHATHDRDAAAHGLMHDASEAYVGDVVQPIKVLLRQLEPGHDALKFIDARVQAAILAWAGLIDTDHDGLVKLYDLRALFFERDRFLGRPAAPWIGEGEIVPLDQGDFTGGPVAMTVLASPWPAEIAERAFRYAFSVLLPDVAREPSSDRWPPPWMLAGLRAALPAPEVGTAQRQSLRDAERRRCRCGQVGIINAAGRCMACASEATE